MAAFEDIKKCVAFLAGMDAAATYPREFSHFEKKSTK
jgi:hypothetical protein